MPLARTPQLILTVGAAASSQVHGRRTSHNSQDLSPLSVSVVAALPLLPRGSQHIAERSYSVGNSRIR